MRPAISVVMLLAVGGGLVYVVRTQGLDRLLQGTRLGAPPTPVATAWKTEEEWVAGEIARDIVEMASYAASGRPPAAGEIGAQASATGAPGVSPMRIVVQTPGAAERTVDLPLAFLWGPQEYAPVARLVTGTAVAADPSAAGDDTLLRALSQPTLDAIEDANRKVSAQLAEHPRQASSHESAALVLAAFALREAAGLSHDLRPALGRMTAHLAMADAYRQGSPSPDGRVAHAALLVLAGRGAEAEAALSALPATTAAERAWRDALFVRLTDDWRRMPDPHQGTLLERMAYVRATTRVGTHSSLLDYLRDLAKDGDDLAELARIAMDDSTLLSVEVGNVLLPLGRSTEENGLAHVQRRLGSSPGAPSDALTGMPGRALAEGRPRVIDRGAWSAYFRRHILHQLTLEEMHTRRMLGLPQRADEIGRRNDETYGTVPQYSFLQDRRESHGGIRPTRFAESIGWTIDHPESVTAFHFFVIEDLAAKEVIRRGPAARAAWFVPPLPRGTTFDYRFRRQALGFEPKGDAVEALRAISPREPAVLSAVAAAHPKGAPIADLERKLTPRIDYDVTLIGELTRAAGDDRPQIELLGRRQCAIGPRWCGNLGYFLAEEGRAEEAEVALRKTFDNAADRVGASRYALWLVPHYAARGRTKDATAVAEEAASTGSGSGMVAMAALLEHRERFDEAEQMLMAARERYGDDARADPPENDDDDRLIGFYHRMANVRGDKAYAERFRSLASRWFPSGLEKLDPAALDPASAREGVAVLKPSATTKRVGLKPGDVVVGVDGYRVRTLRQYEIVRAFRPDMEMVLHVWRYPGFQSVKTRAWNRWLDTDLRTNTPGEPTTPG